jgi:beta-lactamase superfamily II metal-dependent hydrolase
MTNKSHRRWIPVVALLFLAGCGGGDGPTEPVPAPVITVTGAADGATYTGPVTVTISIDRGSYTATLNGQPVSSGRTITAPGTYSLIVTARNGTSIATDTIVFTIQGPPGGMLIIRMFDLGPNEAGGGGDAILVTDSSASGIRHALIDAGPAGADGADPGFVARQLTSLGVDSLAFLLLTHAHGDHYQGMPAVVAATDIGTFFYSGQVRNLSSYNALVSQARAAADQTVTPTDTVPVPFGLSAVQSRFTIIPALPTHLADGNAGSTELNEGSLGASLRRGTFTMFFTGDGEIAANARWRTQFPQYTAALSVLKVGHHGANNAIFDNGFSGTSTWLQHTQPEVSIISSNGITHPRINALTQILQRTTDRTYCTSVHGRIEIRVTSTSTYSVSVERNAAADCVPGSTATT